MKKAMMAPSHEACHNKPRKGKYRRRTDVPISKQAKGKYRRWQE
jgi:hypothetical protein